MKDTIKTLSTKIEFIFVTGLSFGYFMLSSIAYFITPPSSAPITQNHISSLIIYEATILFVVLWFLKQRGWIYNDFKLRPSIKNTGYGILLAFCAYISYIMLCSLVSFMSPAFFKAISQSSLATNDISFANILAVSIINPFFEELLVVGYVITVLKKVKSTTYAVNTSVAIRLVYHLYQGPLGVIAIIPVGLIFAYWYAKKEVLWSVIIAHSLFDFIGLYLYQ
jgi:membrane protease YdiL (CAAX protease family)